MIIPVRCFTCGKVIGDKYYEYHKRVKSKKMTKNLDVNKDSVIEINHDEMVKTPEGEAMDELGLIRYCCRKTIMTHIELINEI
tara:strand:+ start:620 stop:868 length:249 start_codon:yes stop_codon:yes gene_type:complete